uniref:Amidase domain-containing protein n=1 Tax=Bursaphelenchus xylophilus TaxID=6326 RepID=A0A1I7SL06_BURXY
MQVWSELEGKSCQAPQSSLPMARFLQRGLGALYRRYAECEERSIVPKSDDPLTKLSVKQAAKEIREGKLSSSDLVRAYYRRLKHVNLYINAVTETFEGEALEEARKVDDYIRNLDKNSEEFKNLPSTKPLLGIPVSIKSAFQVKGHRNISGLPHRRDIPLCAEDAPAVQRIRSAGGIPYCYTNVPDGCLWIESSNKIHGTTSSPYDNRTTSGGSSGGEGALISAEGSVIGIGSDLAGSIRIPALFNGIFGLKPVNDIPIEGHYPSVETDEMKIMASIGPLARYAEDLTVLYSVLSATPIPSNFELIKPTKVLQYFPPVGVIHPLDDDVKNAVPRVVNALTHQFGVKSEDFELPTIEKIVEWYVNEVRDPSRPAFKGTVNPNPSDFEGFTGTLKLLFGLSKSTFGSVYGEKVLTTPNDHKTYNKLHNELLEYRQKLNNILKDDVILVAPSLPLTHFFHNELIIRQTDWISTAMFSVLGVPVATVPLGLDSNGYPVGVQLVTARGNNYLLLRMQEVLEKTFGGWRPAERH